MDATVADFEALRRSLGVDTWVLLGHSFGGLLAVEYARRHPEATSGLILVETTTHLRDALTHQVAVAREISPRVWPERAAAIEVAAESDVPPLDRLLRIYGEVGVAPLQRQLHWHSPSAQARADGWDDASGLLRCTWPSVLQAYREEGWVDSAPPHSNARLPVPGILIGGRHSEVIGTRNLQESANVWGVPLRWMEHSGHFPYIEEPRELVNLVTDWTLEHAGAR